MNIKVYRLYYKFFSRIKDPLKKYDRFYSIKRNCSGEYTIMEEIWKRDGGAVMELKNVE